jgi:acetylornithine deacetylase/succinyl-diaminopimelate desuccinylase-like protein
MARTAKPAPRDVRPRASGSRMSAAFERIDLDGSLDRLKELLRIPSVSTDPSHDADTRRAADWCAEQLGDVGFEATVRRTKGHPMVVAHADGAAGGPHVLYYGHYDVQPPDPLELWEHPPFEPAIVEGPRGPRIVARGAVDDKGQVMTFVEAFRAWRAAHGALPARVTVLLEGEEESGSKSLDPFLEANRAELVADVAMVSDTSMWDIETPAITYMLRGLAYFEVTLHGPGHDLHSGGYGGAVVNPLNALSEILGGIHDARGRVTFGGFYDDVRALSPAERSAWQALDFDEAAFLRSAGVSMAFGEEGCSVLERIWARPTCDVNGMWGGYTGRGAKTVIPATASAKLSCRLVADQDPKRVERSVRRYFEERTPPGCRWEFQTHGCSPAIRVPTDSPHFEAARRGLRETFGRDPVLVGCGGSIPVVGSFQRILGVDSLLVGFGLDDDRVHSPNEKFEVRCFEMGIRSHIAMLDALAAR